MSRESTKMNSHSSLTIPYNLNAYMSDTTLFSVKKHDVSTTVGIMSGKVFGISNALWVKRFNYRGPGHFIAKWLFGSRAKRLYQISSQLYRKGLPVPEPVLFIEPSLREKNAFFISSVISDSHSLGEMYKKGLLAKNQPLVHCLSETLVQWHMSGAVHGDLKWPNILVREGDGGYHVYFVDLDQTVLHKKPSHQGIMKDLQRFYRFGLELGAEEWVSSDFFPKYTSSLPDNVQKKLNEEEIKTRAYEEWDRKGRKRF